MFEKLFPKIGLLILRISVSILMLIHGIPKIGMLLDGNAHLFPNPIGLGSTLSLILVIGAEVICSAALIVGFKSRIFVLPLMFNLIIIVFVVHAGLALQQRELPILYLIAYTTIAFTGSGELSLDHFIEGKKKAKK